MILNHNSPNIYSVNDASEGDGMQAAVIDEVGAAPRFTDFDEPVAMQRETLVQVSAVGLHPLVRALASGEHYGSAAALPVIPGVDGTGRLADGTRVYFGGVRSPHGTMAQLAAAPQGFCIPLPDDLDEVTAAAIINPGLAAWLALHWRAAVQPGETVLILGATGVSGRIAVHLAQRMGAGRVIAAGRNPDLLDRLPATATVRLGGSDDAAALAQAAGEAGIHVIIDYLWGRPAEAVITAVTRRGLTHSAPRVRLVEVGNSAGPTITLPAEVLRSSGLEVMGSGAGTVPVSVIVAALPQFMALAATGELPIDIDEVPLSEVTAAWQRAGNGRRVVLRPAAGGR
jgi:NADPH2:quinone reductase